MKTSISALKRSAAARTQIPASRQIAISTSHAGSHSATKSTACRGRIW
jgi:hypothetical protein